MGLSRHIPLPNTYFYALDIHRHCVRSIELWICVTRLHDVFLRGCCRESYKSCAGGYRVYDAPVYLPLETTCPNVGK